MSETEIKRKIQLALGTHDDLRLFNNPVGTGWQGELVGRQGELTVLRNARRVNYGLVTGSPDLIGWQSMDINGQRVARFVGLEIKTDRGRPSPEQTKFINVINSSGGRAGIARNIDEALDVLYPREGE
jgi:hypothetical protein